MKKLVLHPTDICQWHAFVSEAQKSTQLLLNESTESYLVFLLLRFSQEPKLIESVVALDFLESCHKSHKMQIELLRDVGDKSLLFCGLFPGIAERKHVNLNYFTDMGQSAYLSISELYQEKHTDLFFQLSTQFITLKQILQAMRGGYLQFEEILASIQRTLQ